MIHPYFQGREVKSGFLEGPSQEAAKERGNYLTQTSSLMEFHLTLLLHYIPLISPSLFSAPTKLQCNFEVAATCSGSLACFLPEGEVLLLQDFREQEPFYNLNYGKVNLRLSVWDQLLRLPGRQLLPMSGAKTKFDCHSSLSPNDCRWRESLLIIGFLRGQRRDLLWTNITRCQD